MDVTVVYKVIDWKGMSKWTYRQRSECSEIRVIRGAESKAGGEHWSMREIYKGIVPDRWRNVFAGAKARSKSSIVVLFLKLMEMVVQRRGVKSRIVFH